MADIIRDVIIKIAIKQEEVRLKAPDIGPILLPFKQVEEVVEEVLPEAFKEFGKDATKSVGIVSDEVEELGKNIQDIKPDLEGIGKASAETSQKLTDDTLKMGEGFRTAGEGAFTLARGIAFVGIGSDEDLQKVVQKIAQIQGAFDIFKGGIDVVKGLTEGTRALRLVTTSAAVAETGLATANTAVATTGAAATVSMRGLLVTLGPIGLALAAVSVAFLFFKQTPKDIEKTTDALTPLEQRLLDVKKAVVETRVAFSEFLAPEEQIKDLTALFAFEGNRIKRESDQQLKDLEVLVRKRVGIFRAGEEAFEREKSLILAERESALLQNKLELNSRILAVQKSQGEEAQGAIDLAKKEIQLSKEKVELEKDALTTFQARFGAADRFTQLETLRASKKVKDEGIESITGEEAKLLGRFGGEKGRERETEFFGRLGVQRGSAQLAQNLGLDFQGKIQAAQKESEILQQELEGAGGQMETFQTTLETINTNMQNMTDMIKETLHKQQKLEGDIDKLNN